MAQVVNLGKARKAKARAEREGVAAANRAKYGRTKEQKQADSVKPKQYARRLDCARIERT